MTDYIRFIPHFRAFVVGWIKAFDPVHHVVSVVDLVDKMCREFNPKMAAASPLPDRPETLAQLLLLFELQGGRKTVAPLQLGRSGRHAPAYPYGHNSRLHPRATVST